MARAALSQKLRFEVFKRDSFTCQYCGRKAPEVILQCDHVKPVVAGGDADILNLITSCFDCNSGKGGRELIDRAVLTKQLDQIAELAERRDQIEMMIAWRDELQRLSTDTLDRVVERLERNGFTLNDAGRNDVRKWLKKYTVADVLQAAEESFSNYLEYESGAPTSKSWNKAFTKIPAFCSIQKQEAEKPYIRKLLYIQGIIRKRARAPRYSCVAYLEHLHLCGFSLEEIESDAKGMRMGDLASFEKPYDDWLEKNGKQF
ncbi:HNH endonuclease [Bradyrhizobium lablabi]|uniref:HNH endonuclease n=1 Tax=Bradyrhizobium lablabi TaxID=722472 RepID=A0A1M6LJG6_9BRAD|nr:HNH endonuclease signature motif containing protein [Bradyrhizobium lablabi]SHJ71341.1 HNH endonuclease [Bradyrhizobium lablabi]